MGNISSPAASTTSALVKIYSPLDTNEDGVVSAKELAAAYNNPTTTDTASADQELPTKISEETVPAQVASALLSVQADKTDTAAFTAKDALFAYQTGDA